MVAPAYRFVTDLENDEAYTALPVGLRRHLCQDVCVWLDTSGNYHRLVRRDEPVGRSLLRRLDGRPEARRARAPRPSANAGEPRLQHLALERKLLRKTVEELVEQDFVVVRLDGTSFRSTFHQLCPALGRVVESFPVEAIVARHPTHGDSTAKPRPWQRSRTHFRTRMFSPKPDHMNFRRRPCGTS